MSVHLGLINDACLYGVCVTVKRERYAEKREPVMVSGDLM